MYEMLLDDVRTMEVASSNSTTKGMSAASGPDHSADFHDDPYAELDSMRQSWRVKKQDLLPGANRLSEVDLGDIDWRKYAPPSKMSESAHVTSEILLEIITTSIDNIKARSEAEWRQEEEANNAQRAAAQEATREAAKGKQPYLPIIIPPETFETSTEAATSSNEFSCRTESPEYRDHSMAEDSTISFGKPGVKRRFALRRLFQKTAARPEVRAESSRDGASQEALRQYLEAKLSKVNFESADAGAQETIAALRKTQSFRVPQKQEVVECVSCLDDFSTTDTIRVPCHNYCQDCFERLVTAACQNEQQWPPKCCLNEISFHTVEKHVPRKLRIAFQERQSEWTVPVSERVYCHQPDCAVWIKPKSIDLSRRIALCHMNHATCTICRGPAHGSNDCPQDQDMNLTNILAEEEGWKRCGVCHALVEHRDACQHMTCRCGHEFCYVCGRKWRSCGCTMQQLQALKRAASSRRTQRVQREQAEAAELRDILAQIEAFEREIARLTELERQEQLRQEEERWQVIVKQRIRQESIRRKEVEQKFQELHKILDRLHQLQQVLVETQQEEDAKALLVESKEKVERLDEANEKERQDINTKIKCRVNDKEALMTKEHAVRVSKERKIEEQYELQLREYWTARLDLEAYEEDVGVCVEEEVETAMLPLRQRMDDGYRRWQNWKEEEMAAYKTKLEDERVIREELMYSAKERLKSRYGDMLTDLTRRMVAENKWVQEIIMERQRLLAAVEVAEMEGDADSLFSPENESTIPQEGQTTQRSPKSQVEEALATVDEEQATRVGVVL